MSVPEDSKKKKNPRKWSVANCCLEVGGSQGVCTWMGTKSVSHLLDWEFSFEKSTSRDLWELSSSAPGQKINGSEDQQGKPSKSEAPCLWLCGLTGGSVAGCASLQGAWGLHSLCLRRSHVTEKEKSAKAVLKTAGRKQRWKSRKRDFKLQQSQEEIQKRNKLKTNTIDSNACKSTASCRYILIKGQTSWRLIPKQDPHCLKKKKPTLNIKIHVYLKQRQREIPHHTDQKKVKSDWADRRKSPGTTCALEGSGPWEGAVPYSLMESRALEPWFHPRVEHPPTHTPNLNDLSCKMEIIMRIWWVNYIEKNISIVSTVYLLVFLLLCELN